MLLAVQGDILEDVELVENLEETKRTATTVGEQVKAAKETEVRSPSFTCASASFMQIRRKSHHSDPEMSTKIMAHHCGPRFTAGGRIQDEDLSGETKFICCRLKQARLQVRLSKAREVYRPVAGRGSLVYFLIDLLPSLDRVYYFSMANFALILQKGTSSMQAQLT